MRCKISIESERPISLPIHYNNIMRKAVINSLLNGNDEKFFVFSNIFGRKRIRRERKSIYFKPPCHFYFSCLNNNLEEKEVNGTIGKNRVKMKVSKEITPIQTTKLTLKTLSPITVSIVDESGKSLYFSPDSDEFYKLVVDRLKIKAKRLNLNVDDTNIQFKPHPDSKFKKAVIRLRSRFVVEAWKGIFTLEAPKKLLELALQTGLGERNNFGFGMVAIANL